MKHLFAFCFLVLSPFAALAAPTAAKLKIFEDGNSTHIFERLKPLDRFKPNFNNADDKSRKRSLRVTAFTCPAYTVIGDFPGQEGYMSVGQGSEADNNPVMSSAQLKKMIIKVTMDVLEKYNKSMDWSLAAAVLSAAVGETSAGKTTHFKKLENSFETWGRPSQQEQEARGKFGTDAEECGIYRMNRRMIKDIAEYLGRDPKEDIEKINGLTEDGDHLATVYMVEAYLKYGLKGFNVYQRQGKPVYRGFSKSGNVPEEFQTDQANFDAYYFRLQTAILVNGLLFSGDGIVPWHQGDVPAQ